jgi:hypothetical protein
MKKLLILCLLLSGCDLNAGAPTPDKKLMRVLYINSLPPEQVKDILLACMSEQWCYYIVDKQMNYEKSLVNGGAK